MKKKLFLWFILLGTVKVCFCLNTPDPLVAIHQRQQAMQQDFHRVRNLDAEAKNQWIRQYYENIWPDLELLQEPFTQKVDMLRDHLRVAKEQASVGYTANYHLSNECHQFYRELNPQRTLLEQQRKDKIKMCTYAAAILGPIACTGIIVGLGMSDVDEMCFLGMLPGIVFGSMIGCVIADNYVQRPKREDYLLIKED